MGDKLVIKEPVLIEDEGRPVAVLLPIDLYRLWQQQVQKQAAPPLGPTETRNNFQREKKAFEQMKPELMERYRGMCVAVVGGEVVEVGEDKIEVIERVRERFGRVSMYVQWVTDQPHLYHFPHRRVIQA